MHPIYTTRCFVLRSFERGEADRVLALLTEDFGFIWALARGMRKHTAKLRGHTQDLSCATVSLVKGKRGWRVTNAAPWEPLSFLSFDGSRRECRARLATFLLRLLDTDEKNSDVFAAVTDALFFLDGSDFPPLLSVVELITVIRILKSLGYGGERMTVAPLHEERGFSDALLGFVGREQAALTRMVNESLTASHL